MDDYLTNNVKISLLSLFKIKKIKKAFQFLK
jgi:hypothetical protein